MTKEEFIELKDTYIDNIKRYFKESGDLFAHVALFCEFKKDAEDYDERPAIVHVPIPGKLLETGLGKDFFVEFLLNEAVTDIKEKFIIKGVAWSAEAWMKMSDKNPKNDIEMDDLPIKAEVIIINIESEDVNECNIFEIERSKMSIEEDGSIKSEEINFKELQREGNPNMGGRFSGLYNKIKN
jgi:hypothetical protein